ncbi:hypothetical protein [Anaeromyxobacter sp. SG66]|uniref:hypothetical protein n=1 Tax=Anaeromyxobacter sp. SG66 TaxID=2925410 RepID=UPI001F5A3F1A|nr:hypothetical protein [Anaeromyxobacter sp. SG66]
MTLSVARLDEWFVVVDGRTPVKTPGGTPVVSHHRELAEHMARDIAATGRDPTHRTNMFALQAGYLDFGLTVPRSDLEVPVIQMWKSDIFVNRPADPELMMPLMALWGLERLGRAEFEEAVHRLTLRQLMVLMQCGAQYQSSAIGLELLSSDRDPTGLALGACARYWAYLNRNLTLANGYLGFGGDGGRHDSVDRDDDYCDERCCVEDGPPEDLPEHCPIHRVFVTMRKWAAYPEELPA